MIEVDKSVPVSNGTTLIGFKYNDGIMLAADTRTSAGQMIACHFTDKIIPVAKNILIACAGNAAHTQKLRRLVEKEISTLSYSENTQANPTIVANLLKGIIYKNKDFLSAAIIVGGYHNGEYMLYKVHSDGTLLSDNVVITGSGGIFIMGYFDLEYKQGMDRDSAIEFATKSMRACMHRDNSSGGLIRLATIEKDVVCRYSVDEISAGLE